MEVLLRITSAPEFVIVFIGGVIGWHDAPMCRWQEHFVCSCFIPFNLFVQLAVRDFVMHAFSRNRFREIITIVFVSIGVIPQS